MLFQSDYWLARNYAQKLETILDFLETDEGIKTLVIVDTTVTDVTKIILETVKDVIAPCVELINTTYTCSYKGQESYKKTIYVYTSLDNALVTIERTQPILAIFV
jgi:hypothetical protein